MTSEDKPSPAGDITTTESFEETITLFAPFEAQKPSRSLFQRSSELESESGSSRVETNSREIVFQDPESQAGGNAKVLFRKLKAAVSGSSINSLSPVTSSISSSQFVGNSNPPQSVGFKLHTSDSNGSLRSHRSKVSPTPSAVSGVEQSAAVPRHIMKQNVNEEPTISLTSYSDAHNRVVGKLPATSSSHSGGCVARPQAQTVNKTEMLKRFGSIADSQVEVSIAEPKPFVRAVFSLEITKYKHRWVEECPGMAEYIEFFY